MERQTEPHGAQISTIELDDPAHGSATAGRGAQEGVAEPLGTILEAIERDADIAIVYAGASGVTHRVVTPVAADDARLEAYCHLRDDERVFWLSSILAVGHAPD